MSENNANDSDLMDWADWIEKQAPDKQEQECTRAAIIMAGDNGNELEIWQRLKAEMVKRAADEVVRLTWKLDRLKERYHAIQRISADHE